jgi:hypothetical protein
MKNFKNKENMTGQVNWITELTATIIQSTGAIASIPGRRRNNLF